MDFRTKRRIHNILAEIVVVYRFELTILYPPLFKKWLLEIQGADYLTYFYDVVVPEYLTELFCLTSEVDNYNLRGSRFDMQLPKPKTNSLKRSFAYRGVAAWNALPNHIRDLKHF